MNLIRSTLSYGRRSLTLCLLFFIGLWLGVSSWHTYRQVNSRAEAVLDRDGEALESGVTHEDEAAVKRILWSLGSDAVKAVIFVPSDSKPSPVLGSIAVGDLSSGSVWLATSNLPLVVNGLSLGTVSLKIDVISVIASAFLNNVVLFLIVSIFSASLLVAANMGSVAALSELEKALQMLALRIDTGDPAGLAELESILSSKKNVDALHNKLMAVVGGVVKAATQMTSLRAEKDREAAVARMMQMMAHDVRRPFSILRVGLPRLQKAQNPQQVKDVLARLLPEVDRAVSSVNGLIQDVMEAGAAHTNLVQEPCSPESLIENSLGEVLRVYPQSNVSIEYVFNHRHMVNVDSGKTARVLSNILANGLQAMKFTGKIWFETSESDGFINFTAGNEGSFIEDENLAKLFSAFYSNRKGGTGLGLAIAEKICKAHGGRIWCTSVKNDQYPSGMVAFHFTLPIANGQICKTTARLPNHSTKVTEAFMAMSDENTTENITLSATKGELSLEEDIIDAAKATGKQVNILVVDDEEIYRATIKESLSRTHQLEEAILFWHAANSDEALEAVRKSTFDLIITDVDMGPTSLDGFELVKELRDVFSVNSTICVHSNRIVAADYRASMASGADAFLPKPMARQQLLKLVLQSTKSKQPVKAKMVVEAVPRNKPEVAIVEDNIFVLEAWADILKQDAIVHALESPDDLSKKMKDDPTFLSRLSCLITDYNFDNSNENGLDVGRMVKAACADLTVLLSSDGHFKASEFNGLVDRRIDKNPVRFADLPIVVN